MNIFSSAKKNLFTLALACSSACSGGDNITLIFEANQCNIKAPELRLLDSEAEISLLKPQAISLSTPDQKEPSLPKVDPQTQQLVLIALGQKNTAGYSLSDIADNVTLKDGMLVLPQDVHKTSGQVVAQVITSPCAVIAIKNGAYKGIQWGEKTLLLGNK